MVVAMPPEAPRVSVVTSVFNGERFLAETIDSVLSQTMANFEYVLVDDASTDGSSRILAGYAARDDRLVTLRNTTNINAAGGLNRGIQKARAEYVAILDDDDVIFPQRLARQVAFLDQHPEVGVLGAQAAWMDEQSRRRGWIEFPTEPALTRWQLLFRVPVLHSAAMMRRDLVLEMGGYSTQHPTMCDYELLARLVDHTEITNLPDCLVAYRLSPGQLSDRHRKPQSGQVLLLIYAMLARRLELRVGMSDLFSLYHAWRGKHLADQAELFRAADLLGRIYDRYLEVEPLDPAGRDRVGRDCAWRWLAMAHAHRRDFREASRELVRRSLDLDPDILHRPETRQRLRQLRRRHDATGSEPVV